MASWSPTISTDFVSETWSTVLLSLRDLRRDVPINYSQYPGIALTPACFADARYTPDKADCVADLIAIGYRSFLLDLYLDGVGGSWGICPGDTDIPGSSNTTSASTTNPTATSATPRPPRQSQTSPSYSVCSPAFNATTLLTIFDTWMTGTNTDLGARILLLTLNLHPTTNQTTTTTPAPPLTSTLKSANILADAYTPTRLLSDRSDLNSSWHADADVSASASADPDLAPTNDTYFTTTLLPDGTAMTPDGWPSESYLEFRIGKRVLISFGRIDAGLPYDPAATGDDAVIFPAAYLGAPTASSSTPHCFFAPGATSVAAANASWAQAVVSGGGAANVTALVNCGYSTLLDPGAAGVNGTGSAERFGVFREQIVAMAAWAWGEGQPVNTTGRKESFRCAAVSASDGRWSVVDCGERLQAACRVGGQPYEWTLTPTAYPYTSIPPTTAPANCSFSAPRTPLENTHLLHALRRSASAPARAYIDLNSLSTDACWVTGGANATCPYAAADDGNREVIVSAVAALIVLVVAGLMWFAKGASWRVERSRRRRWRAAKKRVREGVEYEGVPS